MASVQKWRGRRAGLSGVYTGLASITLTEPRVETIAVISNPAAARRSRNPEPVRTRPFRRPNMLSISRSLATVSQKRKPSRGSLPAGMTHSISRTLPLSAIALRQFRNGTTARSSSQTTRKFDSTYASPGGHGFESVAYNKAAPITKPVSLDGRLCSVRGPG